MIGAWKAESPPRIRDWKENGPRIVLPGPGMGCIDPPDLSLLTSLAITCNQVLIRFLDLPVWIDAQSGADEFG